MIDETISSRDNTLVKHARVVRDGRDKSEIFIEGVRLCEEAANASLALKNGFYTEELGQSARGTALIEQIRSRQVPLSRVTDRVMETLSDTRTPQGIVLLASRPRNRAKDETVDLSLEPLVVVLHSVNNPANAGAILRTAEAAGATAIITTENTTDIFSPKALRASMGSAFRLPVWAKAGLPQVLTWCKERGIEIMGASIRAAASYKDVDWRRPSALVIGSEATGLSEAEVAALDLSISIAMRPPVESLNAAVAAGIILYEAARQRSVSR